MAKRIGAELVLRCRCPEGPQERCDFYRAEGEVWKPGYQGQDRKVWVATCRHVRDGWCRCPKMHRRVVAMMTAGQE